MSRLVKSWQAVVVFLYNVRFTLLAVIVTGSVVAADPIRVATFNVNWGNTNGSEVLAAIAACKADILCLQETTIQA